MQYRVQRRRRVKTLSLLSRPQIDKTTACKIPDELSCLLGGLELEELDLKIAWICHDCMAVFIFADDVKLHRTLSGHSEFSAYEIGTGRQLKNINYKMKRYSQRTVNGLR